MGKITSVLRTLFGGDTNPERRHVTAILLAAGMGTRMHAPQGVTKQMMELCGMPIIARTVEAFEKASCVKEIVLVGREEELPAYEEMRKAYGWKKLSCVTAGGETRQESALCGFKKIHDDTEVVLIHDGARCLVTEQIIEAVAREALVHGAAIAAERASATVKRVDEKGMIAETIDRNTVWLAQTPQGFLTEVYRASVYLTLSGGQFFATDDAMLAEKQSLPVKVVDCGDENIKITTPRDLLVAQAILALREQAARENERNADALSERAAARAKRKEARKI